MTSLAHRIALVTGANRGIGLEVCRQLAKKGDTVLLGARDMARATSAADNLKAEGVDVRPVALDVTSPGSIAALKALVEKEFGRLDVLVNNAGIQREAPGSWNVADASVFNLSPENLHATLATNLEGPLALCQAFIPLMQKNGYGRVVNVSSGMGQLSDMGGGWGAYRLSKVALNGLTRMMAAELGQTDVKINSVCPGWVRTDMGGPNATREVQQGAASVVWAATLPGDGPTGGFFRDGQPLPW